MTTTMPQHMQALSMANEVRLEGARMRRELFQLPGGKGREQLAGWLLDPPEEILSLRVQQLVKGVRRIGTRLSVKLLQRARVEPAWWTRPLRELPQRERVRLAQVLRDEPWTRE